MTLGFRSYFSRFSKIILLVCAFLIVGCSRVSQEAQQHPLKIKLVEPLYPPGVGKYTLNIRVFDENDQPIDDASISVKGDMTHAGMTPVFGEAANGDKGLYKVPFEWTMGGDWIVTVRATLLDGTVSEETFPFTISGDPADCESEATGTP